MSRRNRIEAKRARRAVRHLRDTFRAQLAEQVPPMPEQVVVTKAATREGRAHPSYTPRAPKRDAGPTPSFGDLLKTQTRLMGRKEAA